MKITWDEKKNEANKVKHGIDFADIADGFEFHKAKAVRSDAGGEERYKAIGNFEGRLIVVVFTYRENTLRLISARPASKKEKAYEKGS